MIIYFCFLIFSFLNIFVLIEILKYIRYFTFLFHNEECSGNKKLTYKEFIKFMKKK